jgi:WD40 repeat protein
MPIWSPDNAYFAGVINGDTVVVFDAANGQEVSQYQIGSEKIHEIAWSPDQTNPRLALATRAEVEPGSPRSFPDEGADTMQAIRHSLFVVDALGGTVLSSTTGFRDRIWYLAWSPDGSQLAGEDGSRRLYIWDPSTGELIDSYLTEPYQVRVLEYSPYGGRLLLAYNHRFESQQRADDEFIPISTFAQIEFDGLVQFVAPAASPEKAQSILSQCTTDPDIAATGNSFLASGQYAEFIQWLGQQDESAIPALCADDLQLMAEAISMESTAGNTR